MYMKEMFDQDDETKDELLVMYTAMIMNNKLKKKREAGYSGWLDEYSVVDLVEKFENHLDKDNRYSRDNIVDLINYLGMIHFKLRVEELEDAK